jgi:EmrB/QacA subfamily drug resistance transporter
MEPQQGSYRLIALVVASTFFMALLDGVIINTALPQMAASFGVRPVELSIGVTVYMLTVAMFMPLSGWAADRFGARRIFLLAILVFTLASLGCASASSLPQFALARAIQGIGGGMMIPIGRLIVLGHARKSELLQATALITWPALFAPVIGPVIGGFITEYASWRWNFLLNIPLGAIGMTLVALVVPGQAGKRERVLDVRGFLLTALALGMLLFGLELSAHARQNWQVPLALIAAGLACGTLAVRHLRRAANPLLNLSPFGVQTFAAASLMAGTYIQVAIAATPYLLPLLFQLVFGLNAFEAGSFLFIYFAGNLLMKTVTTPVLRRFGFRTVLSCNGMLVGLSIACCALLARDAGYAFIAAVLFLAGATRSMQFTAINTIAYADISAAQRSSASTLAAMMQQIGMLVGVALATFLLNSSSWLRAAGQVGPEDFRAAFMILGVMAMIASLRFLKLPADAGAEITGRAGN